MAPIHVVWFPMGETSNSSMPHLGESGSKQWDSVDTSNNHEGQIAYFVVTCILAAILCGLFGA
jgi:hypothetical protein